MFSHQKLPPFSLLTFFDPQYHQPCAGAFNLLVARPTACVRTPAILLMHPTGKCKAGEAQVAGSCRSYDEVLLGIMTISDIFAFEKIFNIICAC